MMKRVSFFIFSAIAFIAFKSYGNQENSFSMPQTQEQLQILAEAQNAIVETTHFMKDYIKRCNQETQIADLITQAQNTAQEIKKSLNELSWQKKS